MNHLHLVLGTILSFVSASPRPAVRDERGLSQSTENAILLAGAVAIATIVITVITTYVRNNLPS